MPLVGKDGSVYIAGTGGVCAFDGEGRQEWLTESEFISEGKGFVQAVLACEDTVVLAVWTIPENAAGSGDGRLRLSVHAFDAASGGAKWRYDPDLTIVPAYFVTAATNGVVYVYGREPDSNAGSNRVRTGSSVVAIDPKGKEKWRCRLTGEAAGRLLLDTRENLCFVSVEYIETKGNAAALVTTVTKLNVISPDGWIESSAEIGGTEFGDGTVAVDASNNVLLLSRRTGGETRDDVGGLVAIAQDGREPWRVDAPKDSVFGTPAIGATGTFFLPEKSKLSNRPLVSVYVLTPNGKIQSQARLSRTEHLRILTLTVGADDTLASICDLADGLVLRVIDKSCQPTWTVRLPDGDECYEIAAHGSARLFAATRNGDLYAVE